MMIDGLSLAHRVVKGARFDRDRSNELNI